MVSAAVARPIQKPNQRAASALVASTEVVGSNAILKCLLL